MNAPRILVVEDDLAVQKVLESKLSKAGYEVVCVTSAYQAVEAVAERSPELMILELALIKDASFNGILDGFCLLAWVRYRVPEADFPVIIYTAESSPGLQSRAQANRVDGIFQKGHDPEHLLQMVRNVIAKHQALVPVT